MRYLHDELSQCLWYKCVLEPPASLIKWGRAHRELLARAEGASVSVRMWMDQQLAAAKGVDA